MNHSSNDYPDIIIGGDSWGKGEWQYSTKEILHRGIEQYLLDLGYNVANVSGPGHSNLESIAQLADYLSRQSISANTIILWIQTDPIRDIRPYDTLTSQLKNANGLIPLQEQLLVNAYTQLNTLAIKYNTTVHLIGGLSNLAVDKLSTFSKLNALVTSWVQLLIGAKFDDLRSPYVMGETECGVLNIDLNSYPREFAHQIVSELHNINQDSAIFKEEIFHPDGLHPNRNGHKILVNYIVDKLKL